MADLELDSKNISRLFKIGKYRIQKNRNTLFKRFIAFTYLFGVYTIMTLHFSYHIRIAVKPLGYLIILLIAVSVYTVYIIINHLLIQKVVSHKILGIFNILTLIMLLCLAISDGWASNYHY